MRAEPHELQFRPPGGSARRPRPLCRRAVRAYLCQARSAGQVFCRASRILFARGRQTAERLRATLLHQRRRDPHLHGGDPRGHAGPARRHRVFRFAERYRSALRVPALPGPGAAGRQPGGAGAESGESRGRGGGKGVSRQGGGDAGLSMDSPGAEDDAAAAQRHRATVLDRVLLLAPAGDLRQPRESGLSRRPSGLVEGFPTGSGSGTIRPTSPIT